MVSKHWNIKQLQNGDTNARDLGSIRLTQKYINMKEKKI